MCFTLQNISYWKSVVQGITPLLAFEISENVVDFIHAITLAILPELCPPCQSAVFVFFHLKFKFLPVYKL